MAIYTTQTISGYNASPPSDDGAAETQNEATWSGIKTKIGDPVRVLAQDINTQLITSFATTETRLGNLVDSFNYTGALCPHNNLKVEQTSSTSITVTADKLALASTSDVQDIVESVSETITITTAGASGLDTGTEANSTWYHLFIISKDDGTVDGLMSTSATAPTMPSGYIYKGYVGACYNNSSGNIADFVQAGNLVSSGGITLVADGTATSATSLNSTLATAVPTTAQSACGYMVVASSNTTAAFKWAFVTSNSAGFVHGITGGNADTQVDGTQLAFGSYEIPMHVAQTYYYRVGATGTKVTITSSGWRF